MAIVSSLIVEDSVQADGRRRVREQHTDHIGGVHTVSYLAEAADDVNAIMLARVPGLEAQLAESEATDVLGVLGVALAVTHQTVDEFVARMRAAYLDSVGLETCRLARWIVDALDRGDITVVQCRNAWGVSPPQWNDINGRMDVYAAAWDSVQVAVGE